MKKIVTIGMFSLLFSAVLAYQSNQFRVLSPQESSALVKQHGPKLTTSLNSISGLVVGSEFTTVAKQGANLIFTSNEIMATIDSRDGVLVSFNDYRLSPTRIKKYGFKKLADFDSTQAKKKATQILSKLAINPEVKIKLAKVSKSNDSNGRPFIGVNCSNQSESEVLSMSFDLETGALRQLLHLRR